MQMPSGGGVHSIIFAPPRPDPRPLHVVYYSSAVTSRNVGSAFSVPGLVFPDSHALPRCTLQQPSLQERAFKRLACLGFPDRRPLIRQNPLQVFHLKVCYQDAG